MRDWLIIALSSPFRRAAARCRQERGLKHRAEHETRTIHIPPDLVKLLPAHIKKRRAVSRR